MRVLIVKTSSLGDLIHTLPALTDAASALSGVRFDWVAEEAFTEIPAWHPAVERVIPIALRRWRKTWRRGLDRTEIPTFLQDLRRTRYDLVIDAQGLLFKSALVARLAHGPVAGYDRHSARDPWAACAYSRRYRVSREQHAIARVRQLFARALGYPLPDTPPDYGLPPRPEPAGEATPSLLFLHGTSWPSKHWPERYWAELAALAAASGYRVHLPWGSDTERQRAEALAARCATATVLPRMGLSELAEALTHAAGTVGVDSGLSHLAAALGTPGVTLYGATRTDLTGVVGPRQQNLLADYRCAPCMRRECNFHGDSSVQPACYHSLPPEKVWRALQEQLGA